MFLKQAALAALMSAGLFSGSVQAAPITYTFSGLATGIAGPNSTGFVDQSFSLSIASNTSEVAPLSGSNNVVAAPGTGYLTIAGLFTNGKIDQVGQASVQIGSPAIAFQFGTGYNNSGIGPGTIVGQNAAFTNYDLKSNIGPLPVFISSMNLDDGEISVGGYEADIYQVSDVTFTASLSTVPLPASAPLFGAALLALGLGGYKLKRKTIAAA